MDKPNQPDDKVPEAFKKSALVALAGILLMLDFRNGSYAAHPRRHR